MKKNKAEGGASIILCNALTLYEVGRNCFTDRDKGGLYR